MLALSRSASFILSWCFLITNLCPTDHSVTATAPYKNHTSCPHFFQFISDDTVLVPDPMYCTVPCCTMWLSFATLPCHCLEEKQSCLYFCLSSPWLSLASLCLSSPQFSALFFVFPTILSLLSHPGMQVTYELSLSMHHS